MLSDNGRPYRGDGTGGIIPLLAALGIADTHSRPYHPQTCGKVERVHQTVKNYLRRQPRARTLAELQAQLDTFRDHYNHHRPHRALHGATPADTWNNTPHSGPAANALNTPTTIAITHVGGDGRISIAHRIRVNLGTIHAGQTANTVITGTNAHIFINGKLIRHLTIDPTHRDQRTMSHDPRHP